jgi:Ala-tRNA(Pro) deacylase
MKCRERLETYLRENGVPYEIRHHPLAYTAQEIAAAEHIPGKMLAKVVIARADERMVMLTMPAPYRVDFAKLKALLGTQEVRLAREEEFADLFPDCEVGAMPAFGNLYGVPVYVDKTLAKDEKIVMQAGSHTDTVSLAYADFRRLAGPTEGEFAARG